MKLKTICAILLLSTSALLASPGKCPVRVVKCQPAPTAAQVQHETNNTTLADDTDLLPLHRFSGIVL